MWNLNAECKLQTADDKQDIRFRFSVQMLKCKSIPLLLGTTKKWGTVKLYWN